MAALAAPASAQQRALVDVGREGWLFPAWDQLLRLNMAAFRQTLQILSQAIVALREGRMDVVICTIPSRAKLMQRFLPPGTRIPSDIERRYSQSLVELRQAGALVPDLDELFSRTLQADPNQMLFFKTDSHWTPRGAEVAAIEIARQMREQLGMPPSARPGTRLGDLRPMTLSVGNLAQYVPAAQRIGPEQSWIRLVLPPEGALALIEDDAADVVVVGTSNVQPRFGFQPVLSNQLVRPVALSWKPNIEGPYFALLEYLKSEQFRTQRPRALVWNLLEHDLATAPADSDWRQRSMPNATFLSEIRRLVSR